MADDDAADLVLARIAAWHTGGIIDADTAGRLRAAEAAARPAARSTTPGAPSPLSGIGSAFGPTASIAEMFAYLGAAFLIAAYATFSARIAEASSDRDVILTAASALLTVAVVGVGWWLAGRDERSRRGAGVLFLVAVVGAAVTANFVTQAFGWTGGAGPELFVAVVAAVVAVALRALVPGLATQLGL